MAAIRILIYLFVIVSFLIVSSNAVERSFCYAINKKKFSTPYIQFNHGFINEEQQKYYLSICEEQNPKGLSPSLKQYANENVMEDLLAECRKPKLTFKQPDPASQRYIDSTPTMEKSSLFVLGGEETDITEYPWLVAIDYRDSKNNTISSCGGSLISGRYVITAGHCVVGSVIEKAIPFQVRLGDYNVQTMGPDCLKQKPELCTDGEVTIGIEKIILHPKHYHDNATNIHDIALIRLNQTAYYTKFILPICLPTSDVTANFNPIGKELKMYAVGWGAYKQTPKEGAKWLPVDQFSDTKRHVELPVRHLLECRLVYGKFVNKGHICAGVHGRDTCRGDSGGPLVYDTKEMGVYELAGVVSFGKKWCAREGYPGVYTNVYQYLDWIAEHIKN